MKWRHVIWMLLLLVVQASITVLAQGTVKVAPDRDIVEQKRALVARIIADSTVAENVARSHNAEVKKHLATAARLQNQALAQLQEGDYAKADYTLNDAMRHVGRARNLASDSSVRAADEQTRYSQLMQSIEVLENSYLRNVERRSVWLAAAGDEDLNRIKILASRAKALAASGQIAEANAILVRAQRDMLTSYQNLLGTAPLIYDLRFGSAEEEYQYESDRGRDYEGLVPVAIQEFSPAPESLVTIDRLVEESRTLVAHAKRHAGKKQYEQAIQSQREAITKLQRALEIAGVVVPQRIQH